MTPDAGAKLAIAALRAVVAGQVLPADEARALFDAIMDGAVETPLICGLLGALATRGEAVSEVVAAAEAMRARMVRVRLPAGGIHAIDTCGTGGDGKPTFNISTTAAIVAAAAGATVAKHGNRSHVRPSGSAEGVAALGISADAPLEAIERSLAEARIAFLFAPRLHPAMKHASPARVALGIRTIFNLLGPLTNPASVRRQLVGVPRPDLVPLMAEALRRLGSERVLVVHGECGVCDLTLDGPTRVAELDRGVIRERVLRPEDFGLRSAPLAETFVNSAQESAAVVQRVLAGDPGPARDTVAFNAGAALWAAGVAPDIGKGVELAQAAIADGRARETWMRWRQICPA